MDPKQPQHQDTPDSAAVSGQRTRSIEPAPQSQIVARKRSPLFQAVARLVYWAADRLREIDRAEDDAYVQRIWDEAQREIDELVRKGQCVDVAGAYLISKQIEGIKDERNAKIAAYRYERRD